MTGLFCLLAAVFFVIVAGGHVAIDARPDRGDALGIFLTFAACLAATWAIHPTTKNRTLQYSAAAFAALILLWEIPSTFFAAANFQPALIEFLDDNTLQGGALFSTMRVFACALILGGAAYTLARQRVVVLPSAVYAGSVALLVSALGISIIVSEFRTTSLDVWLNWIVYAAALYLAVATLGRKVGTRKLLETVSIAAGVVALKGVYEFALVRTFEPTYRIFADWNNPNALAGMLAMALPIALIVACTEEGTKRIVAWASTALVVTALVLTRSSGGIATAVVGVVAFATTMLVFKGGKRLTTAAVPLIAGAAFVALVFVTAPKPRAQPTATEPIPTTTVATTDEQAGSTQYRLLLWRGALQKLKEQPVGIGVGTYRFHSAESGLTEQTHLTHQTYLQVALEGGLVAVAGLLVLAVAWSIRMFKGARALDDERNWMRTGVFAAVAAAGANGLIESNLFYFATGVVFFVLIAAGLQLAADGTSPESVPLSFRATSVIVCCVLPFIAALWAMYLESAKSGLLAALERGDAQEIRQARQTLEQLAGADGEAWYLLAWGSPRQDGQRLERYKLAAKLAPSTRHLRALSQQEHLEGQTDEAIRTLKKALEYDPHNLRTLSLKMEVEQDAGQTNSAIATARRIVAVEQTPYLQTRALAELIPTEPYDARIFLAEHETDSEAKAKLLREAVEGFLKYRNVTVPKIEQFAKQNLDFVGETLAVAEEKLARARDAAIELVQIYLLLGRLEDAELVERLATRLTLD